MNDVGVAEKGGVAPRAGAWIETVTVLLFVNVFESPPVRGRGLKPIMCHWCVQNKQSPPVRGRGLKPYNIVTAEASATSPPVRGRGLKLPDIPPPAPVWESSPVRGRGLKHYYQEGIWQ